MAGRTCVLRAELPCRLCPTACPRRGDLASPCLRLLACRMSILPLRPQDAGACAKVTTGPPPLTKRPSPRPQNVVHLNPGPSSEERPRLLSGGQGCLPVMPREPAAAISGVGGVTGRGSASCPPSRGPKRLLFAMR